ncbi:MAG: polysaccharide deacetylase family protein [Gemmatimonadetes bacterium]|nr:polysaccharide deacetylase family protein [Gemmatimonadota bacterium]
MTLLVSIHDVTPALQPQVESLWALCRARRVTPALLVVPNWHGEWPIERHPAFLDWVRARAADGAEVILHGERHDEVGLPRTFSDSVRAFGRTNLEGEFLTLDRGPALERIERGLALVRAQGLDPSGFVPPAWLMKPGTIEACRSAGFRFTEDDGAVYLLGDGVRRVPSPVVRWSGRAPLRAWASVGMAEARWQLQRGAGCVRIAYHPSDLDHPATARSAARELERWLTVGEASRYAALGAIAASSVAA